MAILGMSINGDPSIQWPLPLRLLWPITPVAKVYLGSISPWRIDTVLHCYHTSIKHCACRQLKDLIPRRSATDCLDPAILTLAISNYPRNGNTPTSLGRSRL